MEARYALLGYAFFTICLFLVGMGTYPEIASIMPFPLFALYLGCVGTKLTSHPRRHLGWISLGSIGSMGTAIWLYFNADSTIAMLLFCLSAGMAIRALDDQVKINWSLSNASSSKRSAIVIIEIAAVCVIGAIVLWIGEPITKEPLTPIAATLLTLVTPLVLYLLFPQTFEFFLEILVWPIYRFTFLGPGTTKIPRTGPLIIVANHSSYMDPFWLGKLVPRKLTPMMTSIFYDLPVVRWFMVHVFKGIRVQDAKYRREAPELDEAVQRLDKGECIVVFPEGRLRRSEDQLLQRFGQGIWHILKQRPDTPVILCWIEGGWGSFLSYKNGPPAKGKKFDFWRRITLILSEPAPLNADVLQDHQETRKFLTNNLLALRENLPQPGGPA